VMIEQLRDSFSSDFKAILGKAIASNLGNLTEKEIDLRCH